MRRNAVSPAGLAAFDLCVFLRRSGLESFALGILGRELALFINSASHGHIVLIRLYAARVRKSGHKCSYIAVMG